MSNEIALECSRVQAHFNLLSETARQLSLAPRPAEILDGIFARVSKHLGLEVYACYMVTEEDRSLRLAQAAGFPEPATAERQALKFGETIIGQVATQLKPCLVAEAPADPKSGNSTDKLVHALGLKVYAVHPLLAQERLRGVMLFGSRNRTKIDANEQMLLEAFSAQIAEALCRSHLARTLDQRSDELAETDRRKDEFLAMLAHELRNPLSPIMCAMEVMRLSGIGNPSQERSMDIVERQAQHMARLLDDLLDVSRIRRGQVELRKEPMELTAIIEQAVDAAMPFIDSRKHKLSITLPSTPVWLEADPTRMEQILANLLNNAAKYTEPEGNIWLVAEQDKDQVVIRIRDSGMGIAADKLPTIFDLFTQVDHAQERKHGGLGIGLTLCRRLVEMHGGTINASSAGPGQGSEFTVRLPAMAKAPWMNEEILPDAAAAMRRHRRILIVEDNVDSAKSLGELLEIWGHDVFIAYDGPMAIEESGRHHPDVILLDIGLPGMNGYQVAQELRHKNEMASALIIAVTGYGQSEDKELSKEAGIDYHITKPIDFATLEELLS